MPREFFQQLGCWLDHLVEQLVDWLGRNVKPFIDKLINGLKKIWETVVETALIAAYGFITGLYVIFYAGKEIGETIMEIWDPNHYDQQPSQLFTLKQAPQDTPLPTQRGKAKVLVLEK